MDIPVYYKNFYKFTRYFKNTWSPKVYKKKDAKILKVNKPNINRIDNIDN